MEKVRKHAARSLPIGPEKARHCDALRRGRAPLALALGAVLGLAVMLLALVALGALRDADLWLARGARALAAPWLTQLLWAVSWLGWQPQVALIGVAVAGGLFWRRLVLESGFALLTLVGGTPIYLFMTLLGFRPRPVHTLGGFPGERTLEGTSFPSGHVITYTLFCGFLAYLAYTLARRGWMRWIGVALALTVLLSIGPSRVYLGQHWFSDVLASYLLGAALLVATLVAYRAAKRRQLARIPVLAVAAPRGGDD